MSFATFDALGFPMAAGLVMLLLGLSGAVWRLTAMEDPESPYSPHIVCALERDVRGGSP